MGEDDDTITENRSMVLLLRELINIKMYVAVVSVTLACFSCCQNVRCEMLKR